MGRTITQSCPIYLKHATQQAGDCLRLDGNGHMLRHRVGSTWLRGCAGSRCGAVGLAGVSTPDAMTIMFTPDGATAPPAAAQLIREHLTHRPNMNTINATSLWLFPGIRAGQPLTADRMSKQLRSIGIPLRRARITAIRQLVTDMPPTIVARTLGFYPTTAEHHAALAGAPWSSYTPARTAAQMRA